jgi:aminocarboxymuconate-semialdehyde decarboxylase
VAALDHAVLTCGLKGIEISSFARSADGVIDLSHPGLDALWTRAAELDALVFLHPLGCTMEGRLNRWYLSNVIGQPLEHTIALSHVIFSGVLDRHPTLKLLAAHGADYLPTYLGRSDHAWCERPEAANDRRAHTCRASSWTRWSTHPTPCGVWWPLSGRIGSCWVRTSHSTWAS